LQGVCLDDGPAGTSDAHRPVQPPPQRCERHAGVRDGVAQLSESDADHWTVAGSGACPGAVRPEPSRDRCTRPLRGLSAGSCPIQAPNQQERRRQRPEGCATAR
jgi:hypothetical protein